MSKILVVTYSWTGTSRRVAQSLAASRNWTLAEIADDRPGRSYLRSLLESLLRWRPAIRYDGPDLSGFDAVVLVSPIWAYRLCGPMRSFVAQHREALRDVAVVSTMGGSGASNAVAEVERLIGRPTLLSAAFTTREVQAGDYVQGLQGVVRRLEQAEEHVSAAPQALSPRGA